MEEFLDSETQDRGQVPSEERLQSWARKSAVFRLSKRMLSSDELKRAIARKAESKFQIDPEKARSVADYAIQFCNDNGFLDDVAYAEAKARSGRDKGHSSRRIARDLSNRGVETGIRLSAIEEEADDFRAAIILARKRGYGPFATRERDERQMRREQGGFQRNGFGYDVMARVLRMSRKECEAVLRREPGNAEED